LVIGHNHGVTIKHHALEAGVGAHVLAHLLAHETGVAPSGKGVEKYPERFPRPGGEAQRFLHQRVNRREVAHKREARPQAYERPKKVLAALAPQFIDRQRRLIKFDASGAVTLEFIFDPHENFGVNRLRTDEAAEHATGNGGDEKKRIGGHDQNEREIQHVLRPKNPIEDVELAGVQIKQHRLTTVPRQPSKTIKNGLRKKNHEYAQIVETARNGLGVNLWLRLIQRNDLGLTCYCTHS